MTKQPSALKSQCKLNPAWHSDREKAKTYDVKRPIPRACDPAQPVCPPFVCRKPDSVERRPMQPDFHVCAYSECSANAIFHWGTDACECDALVSCDKVGTDNVCCGTAGP